VDVIVIVDAYRAGNFHVSRISETSK
jgi:hypothetical protein